MNVRLRDLPLGVRKQVAQQLGRKPRRPRGSGGSTRGGRWRCHRCGETFTAWAAAERHSDAHAQRRIECEIM